MRRQQSNAHAAVPVTGSDRITDLLNSDFLHRNARMYPRSSCYEGSQLSLQQLCRLIIEEFPSYPVPTQALARRALRRRVPSHWTVCELAVYPGYGQTPVSTVQPSRADKAVCRSSDHCSKPAACSECQWQITVFSGLSERTQSFLVRQCPSVPVLLMKHPSLPAPVTMSAKCKTMKSSTPFARACYRCSYM